MAYNVISLDAILEQNTSPNDQKIAILTGITSTGDLKAIKIDDVTGQLSLSGVTLEAGDIQIGAVEIKNDSTDDRVNVLDDGINNAMIVKQNKGNALSHSAGAVSDVAAILIASNTSRQSVTITNTGGNNIYLGGSGVTSAAGYTLAPSDTYTFNDYTGDIYAICSAGQASTTRSLEVYIA